MRGFVLLLCLCWQSALGSPLSQVVFSSRPPLTHAPERCPGYRVTSSKHSKRGLRLRLELDGPECNAFGLDDADLEVEVEHQTHERIRVHIYDRDGTNVQIPEDALPYPTLSKDRPSEPALLFSYHERPFTFTITRRATNEVIFSSHPRLIFSDQFIQLTSELPANANIFGLGEVAASSGFRRDPNNTRQAMWAHDEATPVDSNLYGAHPVYLEYRESGSHTVFLRNSHAMDVLLQPGTIEYRAIGGTLDLYFADGPSPLQAIQNYVSIIGLPQMQPKWALGFHLCRWGYNDVDSLREIVRKMKEAEIPHEVQWMDIDYMRGYQDFTLDEDRFPRDEMATFIRDLHADGQYFVPILDLGIGIGENDAYQTGIERDVFLKNHDGSIYAGRVWPGFTAFPDFTAAHTHSWWSEQISAFSELVDFDGLWLDMNEASNFCDAGCEPDDWPGYNSTAESDGLDFPPYLPAVRGGSLVKRTIRPSAKHANGLLQYNTHNLNGLTECRATNKALRELRPTKRPFLLSRSTFPGSGSVASHWLGDNYATWEQYRLSIQGVLQFGLYGVPLVGPDICGFAGNTTEELCGRWMQFGALAYPFLRNHNVIGATSQEPYVWDSVARISRDALKLRLALMPYLYTLLHEATTQGTPIVRALLWEFPSQPELATVDHQVMLGPALLVTPVLQEGATTVAGVLPGNQTWRDFGSGMPIEPGWHRFDAPVGTLPLHLRPGSVLLMHSDPGLTIRETEQGPYMLFILLDAAEEASATYHFDDGLSIDSVSKQVHFQVANHCLSWKPSGDYRIAQQVDTILLLSRKRPGVDADDFASLKGLDLNEPFEQCWQ